MRHGKPRLLAGLVLGLTLTVAGPSWAIDTTRAFDDPELQARYEKINRELRCLVCQNQTIADSSAGLAGDLRREVRELVAAGKTDEEIREFMIARYGDFVLYRPRMTPTTFLLWSAPVLLLVLGSYLGVRHIRRQATDPRLDEPESGSA